MSQAFVGMPNRVEMFDSSGTILFRITLDTWLADISGVRADRTTITVDIAAADTLAQIQTKIGTAVSARATSMGYSIAANQTIMWSPIRI